MSVRHTEDKIQNDRRKSVLISKHFKYQQIEPSNQQALTGRMGKDIYIHMIQLHAVYNRFILDPNT